MTESEAALIAEAREMSAIADPSWFGDVSAHYMVNRLADTLEAAQAEIAEKDRLLSLCRDNPRDEDAAQIASLQIQLADARPSCENCKASPGWRDDYRCADCRTVYCRSCLRRHFGFGRQWRDEAESTLESLRSRLPTDEEIGHLEYVDTILAPINDTGNHDVDCDRADARAALRAFLARQKGPQG